MTTAPPVVWALVPAHNEAQTIRAVAAAAAAHVDTVLIIDDGSEDDTAGALADLSVRLIRHRRNIGKGPRLCEGMDLAFAEGADAVVTLDADGQHDPADIPAFIDAMAQAPGALILGDRSWDMGNMPVARARSIRFGNFFIGWACGQPVPDAQCGMRLYPRALWEEIEISPRDRTGFVFETAVLILASRARVMFRSVPIPARYGTTERPSHFRPIRDFARIGACVTRYLFYQGLRPRKQLITRRQSR